MKISKLFHWLYASVMMLPLFASICFAIYTRNENSTFTQSVEYPINKVVVFNQLSNSSNYPYSKTGLSLSFVDNKVVCNASTTSQTYFILFRNTDFIDGHKYLIKFGNTNIDGVAGYGFNQNIIYPNTYVYDYAPFGNFTFTVRSDQTLTDAEFYFPLIFDLTYMFGAGNEPTYHQFNTWYADDYYPYNLGTQQLLHDYSVVSYSNTDVGSQLIYTLYNSTNNYFNVTNFLGLNNLYDWISLNVFNGTPALAFSLFYMLLSYWLLVSIFWLVFDVVMYVPNLAHRWLDKASID